MIIETAVALIAIFAVLVMFHEWGHFVAARLVGMRVEEFALGFGPKVARLFKRGDTEYTLHPFPLGGFVKIAGMNPGEEDIPDGFQAQAIWKRALVIFAGPFMSFVLGALAFVVAGVLWGFPDFENPRNRVGEVLPQSEAAKIDLRAGDKILEINGVKVTKGVEMTGLIHSSAGKPVKLVVERRGKVYRKTAVPQWTIQYLGARWSFMRTNRASVEDLFADSTASKAQIEQDDVLAGIDGRRIIGGEQMVAAIKDADGRKVSLQILRGGKMRTVEVKPTIQWVRALGFKWVWPGGYAQPEETAKPQPAASGNGVQSGDVLVSIDGREIKTGEQMLDAFKSAGAGTATLVVARDDKKVTIQAARIGSVESSYYDSMGLLGFLTEPSLVKSGFWASVVKGLGFTWERANSLVRTLASKHVAKNVGGPLLIASATASSVALGPYWVFLMLGGLSLSLAFINLLPIPVLDGGHLAILGVEAVRRKRLTPQQMAAVQMAGLAIVGAIFILVAFSDITKLVGGNVPQ